MENKCDKCRCALKMSFIINICLIILSAIVVVSSLSFAYLETTDIETETITIEGGDIRGGGMQKSFDY